VCFILEVSTKISSANEFAFVFGVSLLCGVSIRQLFVQESKEKSKKTP